MSRLVPLALAAAAVAFPATAEARLCSFGRDNEKTRVVGVSCARAERVLSDYRNRVGGAPPGWSCTVGRFESELGDRTRCRNGAKRIVQTVRYAPD